MTKKIKMEPFASRGVELTFDRVEKWAGTEGGFSFYRGGEEIAEFYRPDEIWNHGSLFIFGFMYGVDRPLVRIDMSLAASKRFMRKVEKYL